MQRFILSTASVITAMAMVGCATTSTPKVAERDSVDTLIAQSATAATQALRDLSEVSGNSRVVLTPAAQRTTQVPAPAPKAAAEQPTPAPTYEPIAARSGSISVEVPTTTAITSPSSGVVASGGLLSAPPQGLERLITVRWTGELEQLLSRVAMETGWKLADSTGTRVAPVIISINADNRSAFDVLRDIGAIAGTSADIVVSANARTISVRYPKR